MNHKFYSKISFWLFVPVLCLLVGLQIKSILDTQWIPLVVLLVVTLFILSLLGRTYYLIEDNTLTIVCGFVYKLKINVHDIQKVEKTNSPLSSPALSVSHRIEIYYGKYDSIIISPQRQHEFIETLTTINKNIHTNL
ncbi:PH domain-containing protein [Emticicia sp. 17c]|uniref:PH domain-containing protein n=1 Tax=Emticicia sp. 17c TaxID=3127704 RepID=UPI00301C8F6A